MFYLKTYFLRYFVFFFINSIIDVGFFKVLSIYLFIDTYKNFENKTVYKY